jgi:DNA-directed RNA polymerase specialized sigma24 family protein
LASGEVPPEEVGQQAPSCDLESLHRDLFFLLVCRATYHYGLSKEDARDIVQEAFVLAIRKLNVNRNPRAWLYQVVDHLSRNHRRKTNRRAELLEKWIADAISSRIASGRRDEG